MTLGLALGLALGPRLTSQLGLDACNWAWNCSTVCIGSASWRPSPPANSAPVSPALSNPANGGRSCTSSKKRSGLGSFGLWSGSRECTVCGSKQHTPKSKPGHTPTVPNPNLYSCPELGLTLTMPGSTTHVRRPSSLSAPPREPSACSAHAQQPSCMYPYPGTTTFALPSSVSSRASSRCRHFTL